MQLRFWKKINCGILFCCTSHWNDRICYFDFRNQVPIDWWYKDWNGNISICTVYWIYRNSLLILLSNAIQYCTVYYNLSLLWRHFSNSIILQKTALPAYDASETRLWYEMEEAWKKGQQLFYLPQYQIKQMETAWDTYRQLKEVRLCNNNCSRRGSKAGEVSKQCLNYHLFLP